MSDRASASQLQDRPAASLSPAHQQQWERLWDNTVKKRKKKMQGDRGVRLRERNNSADTKAREE